MTANRTIGEVGERALLAEFATSAASTPDVVVGPGDDAAVIEPGARVLSVDTAVADRHFRLDWSSPEQIGARAVVAAVADIAAMGGRPTGVLIALAAPTTASADLVVGINRGAAGRAADLGAAVLGGDLVAASEVSVSITAVGVLDGVAPVRLGGARVGDVLAVSGPLGASAAGYAVLASGDRALLDDPALRAAVDAFRCPAPDPAQGPVAARAGAHALTDVSDGLVEELGLLCAASGVGVDVEAGAIPITAAAAAAADRLGDDPQRWALAGGEDHELLGAFAAGDVPPGWMVIGAVVAARPDPVRIDGSPPRVRGWRSV
ncbi:thiamine-phosphate kinase [Gordonia crocea]|uniref:Thiamine-monophosphate kinase n=1 Tax=Gordonia crocea TaxID=589162 RepID=A0A7I9UZ01_9ACTN|nr:thiamine-phosphate kinase [Gordonia crocea]GED98414.1 thiamine-monophosphate kinase [Gordonia crocea]